jgi:hypothetical protein
MQVVCESTEERKKGMYAHSQTFTFGIGVYGRLFQLVDWLHIDKDRGTTAS